MSAPFYLKGGRHVKVVDLLNMIDELKPNQYSEANKLEWLNEIETKIFNEIIKTHEGADGISFTRYTTNDKEKALLVADGYTGIYIDYISSKIDYFNSEIDKFTNSALMFNSSYEDYANCYNRTHIPLQTNYIKI